MITLKSDVEPEDIEFRKLGVAGFRITCGPNTYQNFYDAKIVDTRDYYERD